MALSLATSALAAASPVAEASPGVEDHAAAQIFGRDVNDIFKLEKRCQTNGQYCDGVGIKCCGGQCCNYVIGSRTYCGNC
ncbi:hypothetical protein N7541_009609 [Penicillium brevicompactum]|uniref:Uncharacterized protein n=1 Tax=Penicillium brevicompactum TaxID=5074 RepID=A0A9W9QM50_PENBR|nr:hypothetical protein N7541_009609 [Penicillium brevicompactum]